jgi:hypothetical protein
MYEDVLQAEVARLRSCLYNIRTSVEHAALLACTYAAIRYTFQLMLAAAVVLEITLIVMAHTSGLLVKLSSEHCCCVVVFSLTLLMGTCVRQALHILRVHPSNDTVRSESYRKGRLSATFFLVINRTAFASNASLICSCM